MEKHLLKNYLHLGNLKVIEQYCDYIERRDDPTFKVELMTDM